MAGVSDAQIKFQQEIDNYKLLQKEFQKTLSLRQQLEGQLSENNLVKEELDLLEPGANVFKLMGPVLIKHDPEEAKQNVAKRIEYITAEMKRHEKNLKDLESKQDTARETLNKLQQQMRQSQVPSATKAS